MMTNHRNPNPTLASILRGAPVGPSAKLQAACLLRGETFAQLAQRVKANRAMLSMVANDHLVSPNSDRIKEAVAADLGVDVGDIWSQPRHQAAA